MKRVIASIFILTILLVLLSMCVSVRQSQPSGPEFYTQSPGLGYLLFSHAPSGIDKSPGGFAMEQRWAYGYPYRVLTIDTTRYGDWYSKLDLFRLAANAALAGIVASFLVLPFAIIRRWVARKKAS